MRGVGVPPLVVEERSPQRYRGKRDRGHFPWERNGASTGPQREKIGSGQGGIVPCPACGRRLATAGRLALMEIDGWLRITRHVSRYVKLCQVCT